MEFARFLRNCATPGERVRANAAKQTVLQVWKSMWTRPDPANWKATPNGGLGAGGATRQHCYAIVR
jgi:hypothetical protein